ncbi:hypothetical protein JCM5353_006253 [Sporobolomyces roseus]
MSQLPTTVAAPFIFSPSTPRTRGSQVPSQTSKAPLDQQDKSTYASSDSTRLLAQSLANLSLTHQKTQNQLSSALSHNKSLAAKLEQSEKLRLAQSAQLQADMEKEREAWQVDRRKLSKEQEQSAQEKVRLEEAIVTLKESHLELDDKYKHSLNARKGLEEEKGRLEGEKEESNHKQTDFTDRIKVLEIERDQWEIERRESKEAKEELERNLARSSEDNGILKQDTREFEIKITTLETEVVGWKEKNDELEGFVASQKQNSSALTKKANFLRQERDEKLHEIKQLQEQIHTMSSEHAEAIRVLGEKCDLLRNELRAYYKVDDEPGRPPKRRLVYQVFDNDGTLEPL